MAKSVNGDDEEDDSDEDDDLGAHKKPSRNMRKRTAEARKIWEIQYHVVMWELYSDIDVDDMDALRAVKIPHDDVIEAIRAEYSNAEQILALLGALPSGALISEHNKEVKELDPVLPSTDASEPKAATVDSLGGVGSVRPHPGNCLLYTSPSPRD